MSGSGNGSAERRMSLKALFDTNILIDYLNGFKQAKKELDQYESRAISVITWIEVMAGCEAEDEAATRAWLSTFKLITLEPPIAERAAKMRQADVTKKIRLPDAIILATAIDSGLLLVTRNSKDFDAKSPAIRVPYLLK